MNKKFVVRNICIGLIDGLTIPLALAAGLSGLVTTSHTVIIACIAATVAGSLTMSMGGFMEARHYDHGRSPLASASTIGISYITGGIIVCLPYFVISDPMEALKWSAVIVLSLLFISGYVDTFIRGANSWWGGLRVLITGAAASAAAFLVAKLFV